ncbi:MAG TPA: AMP-binding protein [Terracidiphilus sp.]|jgi:long-chain acyl-CoA synthetase|nr:AMP-binding protein [Terracidiphilus sp.]
MRDHLATLLDDFRRCEREVAVVRHQGNRRRVTTYGELVKLAGRFAALLVQRQIGPGERVLIWAQNSAQWIAAFHGCMLRGVLAVPLDAFGTAEFAVRVAADVTPKLAVGDAALLEQLPPSFSTLSFEDWPSGLPAEEVGPVVGLSRETALEILFTSGTTGEPKGIVLTHGNVLASVGPIEEGAKPYLRWERLVHPLRILHTLPLSHVFGQTMGLWVPPILTAELHFEERLVAPRLVEMIRRERISVLAAVPRVLTLLKTHLELAYPGLGEQVTASRSTVAARRWWRFRKVHRALGLKFWALISGGGALAAPLEQFWNALGFVLVQGYGMTETTALITLNHPFHVTEGTIGKPLAGREVKLGPDGEVLVRGASISGATWSSGKLHRRTDDWLRTGDLAEMEPSGDLRFLGRKSEVIVTTAGVNVHPEDLEAAIEEQPGVTACAVVPMDTAEGPEPCAVLVVRGPGDLAAAAIEGANLHLAEFQRLRQWVLWPEPDLPRTSTGKVRRKAVAEWLRKIHSRVSTTSNGTAKTNGNGSFSASQDWLVALIEQISGDTHPGVGDELHLTEDLHLDSLGRVQLAAAIEDRLGIVSEDGMLDRVETLGELRRLVSGEGFPVASTPIPLPERTRKDGPRAPGVEKEIDRQDSGLPVAVKSEPAVPIPVEVAMPARGRHIYPHWPWLKPFQWARVAFIEAVMRPLVWLLAKPRVVAPAGLRSDETMLIVANHVTAFDAPLIEYALPAALRQRIAVAMSGEMLDDYRHFRNSEPLHPMGRFFLPGPLFYFLVTALFNVFPLPRRRDFQPSFAHAGKAMDRGYNVMVFPEGTRSAEGELAQFRPGIGLLAKQSGAAVLPVAIRGLGELKMRGHGWFRSGSIEVRIGSPVRFKSTESEAAITARLHDAVERLMKA